MSYWFTLQSYCRYFAHRLSPKRKYFEFNGTRLAYYYSLYNFTFLNERCIEIPIALSYISVGGHQEILEVGNVLSHYSPFVHDIVDKFEEGPGVINVDIADFIPGELYDLIISISTLEHIAFDEHSYGGADIVSFKSIGKITAVYNDLKMLLQDGGTLVVTVPLGFNPDLDESIRREEFDFTERYFFKRAPDKNSWRQIDWDGLGDVSYVRNPSYWHATAIMIGVFSREPVAKKL